MNFDKTKVYTAVNADELKAGDKVCVADNLFDLQHDVENECNLAVIKEIYSYDKNYRFRVKFCNERNDIYDAYYLAYLVEKAEEKKWKPFKDIQELIDAWASKTGAIARTNTMPLIWIKYKSPPNEKTHIIAFSCRNSEIYVIENWLSLNTLFDDFTFLDGTPCGVKE
jgi:hypothetical protein